VIFLLGRAILQKEDPYTILSCWTFQNLGTFVIFASAPSLPGCRCLSPSSRSPLLLSSPSLLSASSSLFSTVLSAHLVRSMALNNNERTTLRHFLSQQKATVPCVVPTSKNTSSNVWPELWEHTVTLWHDFTLPNLNASYGHVLDAPVAKALLLDLQSQSARQQSRSPKPMISIIS
jgi:hypothetical protein